MAFVKTDSRHYENIASKIREKTGTTTQYKPAEMQTGIDEVYEAGKKAEYDAFWYALKSNPVIVNSSGVFAGSIWNDTTFNPPKKLTIKDNCNYAFYNNGCTSIVDKIERIVPTGITSLFQYSNLKYLCPIDLSNSSGGAFAFSSQNIVSIPKIIVHANVEWYVNVFQNASALEYVVFEGEIGKNGLNLRWSTKLSKESIVSIINALSITTSGLSVTLSQTAKENAFTDEEWATLVATKPNWTISLA